MLGVEKDTEKQCIQILNPVVRSRYRNKCKGFRPKGIHNTV